MAARQGRLTRGGYRVIFFKDRQVFEESGTPESASPRCLAWTESASTWSIRKGPYPPKFRMQAIGLVESGPPSNACPSRAGSFDWIATAVPRQARATGCLGGSACKSDPGLSEGDGSLAGGVIHLLQWF